MNRILLLCFCVLLATVVACSTTGNSGEVSQPIAYDHNKHVEQNEMECLDCHQNAEDHARASIPNIDICRDCHEEAITESDQEAILVNYITENKKIPWRQVYSVRDYAYFSHQRHVKLGELECTTCHGDVGTFTTPITKPHVVITMNWCLDCHEEREVTNDCYACHR